MTDKNELAKRVVACKVWRWMSRMACSYLDIASERTGYAATVVAVSHDGWPVVDVGGYRPILTPATEPLPDLDDPATLGCLLALVREAHGDPDLCTLSDLAGWSLFSLKSDPLHCHAFKTEVEVLVNALEASPRG